MRPIKFRMWFYGIFSSGLLAYVAYAIWMPNSSYSGELPRLDPAELAAQMRLRGHVQTLASKIGARNVDNPENLVKARDYLHEILSSLADHESGTVSLEGVGRAGEGAQNVVFEVPGTTDSAIVVVGAHYDSCNDSPGANDNASGVAVALEMARAFARRPAQSVVRVALFANEEPPFFKRPGMGSRINSANAKLRGDPIRAMMALETMGFYSDDPGSQRYPWPMGLVYPSQGDFLAFVGDMGSRALVHEALETFRTDAKFPSEGAALPATFPGVDWSDHWSFRQEGYPAIMITDTAVYRDPHYHKPTDTAGRLNYEALARVAVGMESVIRHLAR